MNKSFTLIEILVVIVIIGILSGFIIVSMAGVSSKATIAKGQVFASSLKNALLVNLVSEWRLDEGSGAAAKDQWGVNDGTLTNSPTWVTSNCVSGNCVSFDGINDYIACGSASTLNITKHLTIGAWVKMTIASYSQPIAGNWYYANAGDQEGYRLDKDTNDKARLYIHRSEGGDNGVSSTTSINNGAWHYLVGTFIPSTSIRIYVDGVLENTNTTTITASIQPSTRTFNIGYYYANGDYYFTGTIDDVRVYNEAIPTSRVQENYYSGLNRLLLSNGVVSEEYQQRLKEFIVLHPVDK